MAPPDQPIDDLVPRDGAWSWYSPGPPRRALLVAQEGTAMPAPPVIDVEGFTVTYGDFTAVRDLSFHVARRRGQRRAAAFRHGLSGR